MAYHNADDMEDAMGIDTAVVDEYNLCVKKFDSVVPMTSILSDRAKFLLIPLRNSVEDKEPLNKIKATFDATQTAIVQIEITKNWDAEAKKATGEINVIFESTPTSSDIRVALFVTEDSIVAPQSSIYFLSSGPYSFYPEIPKDMSIPNFVHEHVVRGELLAHSYWGKSLTSGKPTVGTKYNVSYEYIIPNKYGSMVPNINKLSLVAVVCANNGEVYNASKIRVVDNSVEINKNISSSLFNNKKFAVISNFKNNKLSLYIIVNSFYKIKIFDLQGRLIEQKNRQFLTGKNSIALFTDKSIKGIFIVTIESKNTLIERQKITIIR